MDTVFIIGIFLSIFLSLLVLAKQQKSLPDIILAVWLGIIAIHLSSYYLYSLDYWTHYPHLIGVTLPLPLLHGPMLYLYTVYSTRADVSLRRKDYLHFLPALATWLYMSRFYFFYTAEEKILVDTGRVDDFSVFSIVVLIAFIISGLTYPILAYLRLGAHKQLVSDNFSNENRISLDWLRYWIYGVGLLYLTVAAVSMLSEGLGVSFPFNVDFIYYIMVVFYVVCIGYFGIRHQNIIVATSPNEPLQLVGSNSRSEYKKSGLKPGVAEEIHQKLTDFMHSNKPYLNPELTLNILAKNLEVSANHLSQIINQYENVNFYDFVNRHRVEAFILNASANKRFTLLAHAYDAGFNSKSTFNNVFKKLKGITPSRYLSELQADAK